MYPYLIELARRFPPGIERETGIGELAALFHCSSRYTKTIMKQLHQQGDIRWISFQGRGKKPRLRLNKSLEEIIRLYFQALWEKGEFQKAFQLIAEDGMFQDGEIQRVIEEAYGLHQIVHNEKPLDVFRYPYPNTRLVLDPLYAISRHDVHFVEHIFEPLLRFDPELQQPVPNLAHAVDTGDGVTWRILLRKGVRFHDGTAVRSSDVMGTLNRAMKRDRMFIPMERVNIEDDYSLTVQLKERNYLYPRIVCSPKLSIVPLRWIEGGEDGIPPGTGPFRLASLTDTLVKLEAFEHYFGCRPWLDQVEVIHTPNLLTFGLSTSVSNDPDEEAMIIEQVEQGADFVLLNGNESSVFHDEAARHWLYSAIESEAFCLREEGEFAAASFLVHRSEQQLPQACASPKPETCARPKSRSLYPKPDLPWPTIRIRVQQIRPEANHMREAKVLERLLHAHGLQCALELVSPGEIDEEAGSKYDCFVGGIAFGKDWMMSAMAMLQAKGNYFMSAMPEAGRNHVRSLLRQLQGEQSEAARVRWYEEIESYYTSQAILKFLAHRRHTLYVSKHSPFYHIRMDANGKIDYRAIVRSRDSRQKGQPATAPLR
ncbi:ABC transporter substrate-binding protein [Paenibacillus thiaminolyticus]|uniref:ABC transporter substrate-binding protein n=1 Tax=Paenibacillus thiaminolyticus TaxID=49283 RepID=UPI00232BC3BB|nr:ABC transporter substrate-binding protein [Paenibacillus thiaminolyticus]WCF10571.1 ABC transporter substrate-binding protein [Paenibacillus thiaminolyticus]